MARLMSAFGRKQTFTPAPDSRFTMQVFGYADSERPVMTVAKKAFDPYSTITCPECGYQSKEEMPTDSCQTFYECQNCQRMLRPKEGDCCVYCSFGDVPCPPVQRDTGRC